MDGSKQPQDQQHGAFDAPFHSFWFPEHGTLSNRQVNYMVTQFKSSVKSFVLDNQTPFVHPFLYEETWPTVYQGALGVCSPYIQRTPQNRQAIFRTLDCKVAALVQTSTALLARVEDNLLALQALILYQVIQLFDGEVKIGDGKSHWLEGMLCNVPRERRVWG